MGLLAFLTCEGRFRCLVLLPTSVATECGRKWKEILRDTTNTHTLSLLSVIHDRCVVCDVRRIDHSLVLEPTPKVILHHQELFSYYFVRLIFRQT